MKENFLRDEFYRENSKANLRSRKDENEMKLRMKRVSCVDSTWDYETYFCYSIVSHWLEKTDRLIYRLKLIDRSNFSAIIRSSKLMKRSVSFYIREKFSQNVSGEFTFEVYPVQYINWPLLLSQLPLIQRSFNTSLTLLLVK